MKRPPGQLHNLRLPLGPDGTIMAGMNDRPPHLPPDSAPGLWQTWGHLPVLALTIFLFMAYLVCQLLFYGLTGGLMLPVLAGALVGVMLPLELLRRRGVLIPEDDLGLDRPDRVTLALVVVIALASLAPVSLLAEAALRLHPVDAAWAADYNGHLPRTAGEMIVAGLAVLLVAPLAEEIIFRAFLQRLATETWGVVPGIVVSALAFGLLHGEPWYLFGLIGVGLVLGLVWAATRSLTACWLAHAVHNAVSLIALLRGEGVSVEPAVYGAWDWVLVGVSLAALATAGWALVRRGRRGRAA